MNTGGNDSEEVRRLQRTIGDLETLLVLTAMWADLGPANIARSLAEVLLSNLDLDLVYIRLAQPGDSHFVETVRSKHRPDADSCISEARASLAPLLTSARTALAPVTAVPDPFGARTLRASVTRLGLVEEQDVLVAGSERASFPDAQERLLLEFAANRTALILQRQRAEQALQQSEERFRGFADAAPAILWVTEPDGFCSFLSQGWYEFTGQGEDEGRGFGWLSAVHPDDREEATKHFLSANERKEAFSIEYRLRRIDGTYRWVIDAARPRFSRDGQFLGYAGNVLDITDRKQSEEEMANLLAAEKRRTALLADVAKASKSMNAGLTVDSIAGILTEEARSILGAHQAVTSLTTPGSGTQAINVVSVYDKYPGYRTYSKKPGGSDIDTGMRRANRPMRMTQQELEAHPAWKEFKKHTQNHPLARGRLAAPLIGYGGKKLGSVQLMDKVQGDFTQEDEAILVQLAAIAAAGIENACLYEQVREQDRRKDEFLATLAHELRNPLAPIRTGLAVLKLAPSIEAMVKSR